MRTEGVIKRLGIVLAAAGFATLGAAVASLGACTDLIENLPGVDAATAPAGQLITRTDPSCVAPPYGAHVVYQSQGDNHLFRIDATPGAPPEDISAKLDALGTGSDEFIDVAADGDWIVIGTTRFGCDTACLVVVSRDVCTAQVVVSSGNSVLPSGTAAIASGGNVIVYAANPTPQRRDLFMIRRLTPTTWSDPENLTGAAPSVWNERPSISADGGRIAFDCGTDPSASTSVTSVCQMGIDGTALLTTTINDVGLTVTPDMYLSHPAFLADGSLVIEGSFNETPQIWQLAQGKARLLDGEQLPTGEYKYGNDTGPCVLPDNRVVSTWALRDPTKGVHELKVTDLGGANPQLLLPDVDVVDDGIGCSR